MLTLTVATTSAHPDKRPGQADATPGTCDGKTVTHHRHRARALLYDAYDHRRWETGPKRSVIRKAQQHKRCIAVDKTRRQIAALRAQLNRELEAYADQQREVAALTPYDCGSNGSFAIPCYIVNCESRYSWSAANPSGAVGPYQLLGWGAPWPVRSQADKTAHHRIAAQLWSGGAGASHWVCA